MQSKPDFVHHFLAHSWRLESGSLVAPCHGWTHLVTIHCYVEQRVDLENIRKKARCILKESLCQFPVQLAHRKSKVFEKLCILRTKVSKATFNLSICFTFLWMPLSPSMCCFQRSKGSHPSWPPALPCLWVWVTFWLCCCRTWSSFQMQNICLWCHVFCTSFAYIATQPWGLT